MPCGVRRQPSGKSRSGCQGHDRLMPGHGRLSSGKLEAGQLAHAAASAVATDQVLRAHPLLALRAAERELDALGGRDEARQLRTAPNRDAAAVCVVGQVAFQRDLLDGAEASFRFALPRLVDQEQPAEVPADLLQAVRDRIHAAGRLGQLGHACRHRRFLGVEQRPQTAPRQRLGAEHAHRACLDGRVSLAQAFDHQNRAAVQRELSGQEQARRASAHHHYLEICSFHGSKMRSKFYPVKFYSRSMIFR
jgi:hypothetical protein